MEEIRGQRANKIMVDDCLENVDPTKFKEKYNGLIVPHKKTGHKNNYMFECYYEQNIEMFMKELIREEGILLKILKVPGGMMGHDYLIIYQNETEIDCQILC